MNLITDRTWDDVAQGNAKGQYGAEDLNRVEAAVDALVEIAKALDIHRDFTVKLDWSYPGVFSANAWPTASQMQRYLENVSQLCSAVEIAAELPASMEDLNWEGANRIESALEQVNTRIQAILQIFRFSGEIFAGEESYL